MSTNQKSKKKEIVIDIRKTSLKGEVIIMMPNKMSVEDLIILITQGYRNKS